MKGKYTLPDKAVFAPAFSLVEMLMALLVASLLLAALAPVITRRMQDSMTISVEGEIPGLRTKTHEIEYNSSECSEIKTDGSIGYCEGVFTVPAGFNGYMTVTLIGAGGGGGTAPTAGYAEYTNAGSSGIFKVPSMVSSIEATLVSGGAAGGAGNIDEEPKGYAYTFSGILDRNYVSENDVNKNIKNIKVSGTSVSASYAHGTATLKGEELKYAANNQIYVTLAGGGGGGGRGYAGTGGGGGAAYKRVVRPVSSGTDYSIAVGAGGKGHACKGSDTTETSAVAAGCGGSSSFFGNTAGAAGGGGGLWHFRKSEIPNMVAGADGTKGQSGALGGTPLTSVCLYSDLTTGKGATGGAAGGSGGENGGNRICNSSITVKCAPGSNGGGSLFGRGGVYSYASSLLRHGQGYGAGGCGGGAAGCSSYPSADAGENFTGDGAPGFVAVEWYNISNGGSGGGGGSILPLQTVFVTPGEDLTVGIGAGAIGARKTVINSIDKIDYSPMRAADANSSYLKRNGNIILKSSNNNEETCNSGGCGGDRKGRCKNNYCHAGLIYNSYTGTDFSISGITGTKAEIRNSNYPGFVTTGGFAAGNKSQGAEYTGTLDVSHYGGDGGTVTLPFPGFSTCNGGKGGTPSSPGGKNGDGYGCGGGGGYGLADGGNGSGGYARISWNKFWNKDKEEYEITNPVAGGGGASGNILTYSLYVRSGEKIKIKIGKGGNGAKVVNNNMIKAADGGDTTFKNLTSGGGKGGNSPEFNNGIVINGTGGSVSAICSQGCIKGTAGLDGDSKNGGKGGDSSKRDSKGTLVKYGTGGNGGILDMGDNSNGKSASGFGAGGGGAAIKDLDKVDSPSFSINNPNIGGDGANGKIIIQWQE